MKGLVPILCSVVFLIFASGLEAQDAPVDAPEENPGFRLIIHADNPTTAMTAKELARMFIKKVPSWKGWKIDGDEVKVIPIDQVDNEVRQAFSRAVHDKSVAAIERYWQRMIFSGRGVNPEKYGDDAEVIAYVRSHRGAIGYVSSETALADGVKELRIRE